MENEIKKKWPCADNIPEASRNIIDRIEYWLFRKGFGTQRMFCKWFRTMSQEAIDSIDLDVKDIKII